MKEGSIDKLVADSPTLSPSVIQSGLIPSSTDYSNLPIPVNPPTVGVLRAHLRSGPIVSLYDFAGEVWKRYEKAAGTVRPRSERFMWTDVPIDEVFVDGEWDLWVEVDLFSHLKKSKVEERSMTGALYLIRHLRIDEQLLVSIFPSLQCVIVRTDIRCRARRQITRGAFRKTSTACEYA